MNLFDSVIQSKVLFIRVLFPDFGWKDFGKLCSLEHKIRSDKTGEIWLYFKYCKKAIGY